MSTWDERMDMLESETLDYLAWIDSVKGEEYTLSYLQRTMEEARLILYGDRPGDHIDREHYERMVIRLHREAWTLMHRLSWWGDIYWSVHPDRHPAKYDLPRHHNKYWDVYEISPDREWWEGYYDWRHGE